MTIKKLLVSSIFIFFSLFNLFSSSVNKNMAYGLDNYKSGEYLNSIYYFNLVLENEDELYNEALFWKAKSYYGMGYYTDCKNTLENFFRNSSVDISYYEDARFLYCKIFFKLENYSDALLLFKQFLRNDAFVYYRTSCQFWIGECYLQLSQLNDAKEAFQNYITMNPDSLIAFERVALIDRMQSIITNDEDNDITIKEKAEWFVEYVLLEDRISSNSPITKFINEFENKEDFFRWLDTHHLEHNISDNKTSVDEDAEIILEDDLLNDLENKLLNKLGVED